jgi:hypothetical protein
MIIRVQNFGGFEDPNAKSPPELLQCRAATPLKDGAYRLTLIDGRIRTIAGDFDIEEVLADGTFRPLPR